MLKGKSKAFKPKGPIRRPVPGGSSGAPTREPTREPTPRAATPSLKRKERDEDATAHPPNKRLATPPLSTARSARQRSPSPTAIAAPRQHPPLVPSPQTTQDEPLPRPASKRAQSSKSVSRRTPLPQTAARSESTPTTQSKISTGIAQTSPPSIQALSARIPTQSTSESSTSADVAPRTSVAASSAHATTQSSVAQLPSQINRNALESRSGSAGGPLPTSIFVPSAPRSGAASLGGAGDVGGSDAGPSHGSQLVPMAALNPDGTSGGIIEQPVAKGTKRKVVKQKKAQIEGTDGDDRATLEMQLGQPRVKRVRRPKAPKPPKEPKKRADREGTPSGAEDEVVDPTTLTMSALCKDLRIGKKFSRHDDIKARVEKEKDGIKARKLARENPELAELIDGEQEGEESNNAADGGAAEGSNNTNTQTGQPDHGDAVADAEPEEPDVPIAQGRSVMMRIVDGQIVVDERSVQIDRHREAERAQDGPMEVVEENDFTRIITSGTYMKREKSQRWDWPAMEMFYKGLRTFGTDFGMIANLFPHRTRKQIKLRFNQEERDNPELINRALSAPQLPIDFEEYSKHSRKTFLETAEIAAEQEALKAEHEAALEAAENRHAAANKKKKDAIRKNSAKGILDAVSDDEDQAGGSSAKENRAPSAGGARSREPSLAAGPGRRGKKAAKQGRANKHSMRAGGDEVEILGTVD